MRTILIVATTIVGAMSLTVFVLPQAWLARLREELRHPQWPLRFGIFLMQGKMPPLYDQSGVVALIQENVIAQITSRMNEAQPPLINLRVTPEHIRVRYYWALEATETFQRVRLETCMHCCMLACTAMLENAGSLQATYTLLLEKGYTYELSIRHHSNGHWYGTHVRWQFRRSHPNDCETHKKR